MFFFKSSTVGALFCASETKKNEVITALRQIFMSLKAKSKSGTDYLTGLKGELIPSEAGNLIYYFLTAFGRTGSMRAWSGM